MAEDIGDAKSFLPGWRMCDPAAVSKSLWQKIGTYIWVMEKSCNFYPVQNYLSFVIWSSSLTCWPRMQPQPLSAWESPPPGGLTVRSSPDPILKATFQEVRECLYAGKGLGVTDTASQTNILGFSILTPHLEGHAFLRDERFLLLVTKGRTPCACQAMARTGPGE